MAVLVICQSCQRKLNVKDEILGKRVKCPGCAAIFTAVAAPVDPPAPQGPPPVSKQTRASMPSIQRKSQPDFDASEGEEGDEESVAESRVRQKISARDSQAGWKATKTGLNLLLIAAYLNLSGIILYVLDILFVLVIKWTGGAGLWLIYTVVVLFIIIGILGFAAFVLHIIGLGFCLSVPQKEGNSSKTLALTAFILMVTGIGFSILGFFIIRYMTCIGFLMSIVAPILMLAAHVIYLFFLRSVGFLMKRKDLAGSATGFMFANLGFVVSNIVFVGIMFSFVEFVPRVGGQVAAREFLQTMSIGMIIGVVFLAIFALVLLAWYMILVRNLRDGITPKLTKGES